MKLTGLVLFVCVENTFRSVMAEAIFNASAPPGWRAESAGVRSADMINPVVVELLREIGIELEEKKPRVVTAEMLSRAWRVVTFKCLDQCPAGTEGKSEEWPFPGSTGRSMTELRQIRDGMRERIMRLAREISQVEQR